MASLGQQEEIRTFETIGSCMRSDRNKENTVNL